MALKTAKQMLRAVLPAWARRALLLLNQAADPHCCRSYAQEGEDLILRRLFESDPDGFYVDVGAHHPKRFSNTWIFYERGWSGINVDPNPESVWLFRNFRPRDITVHCGISDEPGNLAYYQFNDSALNTFDSSLAQERQKIGAYRLIATTPVAVRTLADILDQHLPTARPISFLSVDAEGFDLKVLRSNNWGRFRPRYVLTETIGASLSTLSEDLQCRLLTGLAYEPFAKTLNTVIYRDLRSSS